MCIVEHQCCQDPNKLSIKSTFIVTCLYDEPNGFHIFFFSLFLVNQLQSWIVYSIILLTSPYIDLTEIDGQKYIVGMK